ncbi:hypothetical protein L202_02272 [Cryptococcus amylolentus CBS 6039]|uniref:Condensation domain-containing protein n=1 Tax=Cryptococcus amylolentus CBS 6039 TaxID=1295533 RepID=A0A1E3I011_9TREE|nr:hypothetical protein L202_02272 [Cryptococcus amylolentus CBS 6039]ODN81929.1 hypothetical protein L202_02272 [Cryptococcus amylolentus CBS 6039]
MPCTSPTPAPITPFERPSRPITFHARYCLARRNTGSPPILIIAASYPSSSVEPDYTFLSTRIVQLQEHFPHLYVRITGLRTTTPREELRDVPWTPAQVLREGKYEDKVDRSEELERVLFKEGQRMCGEDVDHRPLWQISVWRNPNKERVYITLAADHVIVDGRGLSLLFDALLFNDISHLPYEKLQDIELLENTINIKPSLWYALPRIWQGHIIDKLPKFIQSFLVPRPSWPGAKIHSNPLDASPDCSMLSISADKISALKRAAAENHVYTLHPLLKSIFSLAIWSKHHSSISPFRLHAITPRSERNPTLGHAYCMANYVSFYNLQVKFGENGKEGKFYEVTSKMAGELVDATKLKEARMGMGIMAYLPNKQLIPEASSLSPSSLNKLQKTDRSSTHSTQAFLSSADPRAATTWEHFFLQTAASVNPYTDALCFSNIGRTKLPPGADDLAWSQIAAGVAAAAYSCTVMGHEAGVRIGTIWVEGAAVFREDVKDVERRFMVIMERLIQGEKEVKKLVENMESSQQQEDD